MAYRKELKNVIKTLPDTQSHLLDLVAENPITGIFLNPKVHKEGNPGRPIVLHFAPQYANLFMAKLEEDFLYTCNTKPLTYLRYIDDIFIIWTDTEQELIQFQKQNHHLKKLKADFINRGYYPIIIDQYIHAATRIPRIHLLQYKQIPEINRVPVVVTYNPQLKTIIKITRDLQGTLHKDEKLKSLFPEPPLLAFRQPSNLKSLITRRALLHPSENGTYPCGKKQCKTCPHILTSDKIPILYTLEEYCIHGQYNCSSSIVVYKNTKCIIGGLYIGETEQSLRKKNTYHRKSVGIQINGNFQFSEEGTKPGPWIYGVIYTQPLGPTLSCTLSACLLQIPS
ncbi:hypothetical protein XELAEV_18015448mg [Xenopus laevis]|uniref:Reverse transcriptase domain-containing protein n=1 Tax=Xenopus laevis TaxID=8355 RepID=A0A974HVY2_XENLA|nr:hypothetical protein XELAEV_18015448mg [Xenopus laevis]